MRKIRAPSDIGPIDSHVTAPTVLPAIDPATPATRASHRLGPPNESAVFPDASFKATTPATAQGVRCALVRIVETLGAQGLASEDSAKVEVVLAEVMNNITEHAFCGQTPGHLHLQINRISANLSFRVEDDGDPMPNLTPPPGIPHDLSVDFHDLPEGGFGWFLIRELTENLRYQHDEGRNCLTFTMKLSATP